MKRLTRALGAPFRALGALFTPSKCVYCRKAPPAPNAVACDACWQDTRI